ncbi:tRNA (adenine(22)-N(1))-methyltransferase TrmK [Neptuniibacter sp. PT34_22]|uniref:tRNA (adenine(22)-N(1))-methyltransferase TrmK n=1 Tax=Neptuniibacter sp. PT34_22 TaxID=3398205 RepID=UPI0039F57385
MGLSTRLNSILKMIDGQYDHIWDCCCDHGYLGQAILQAKPEAKVHFLDVVESITSKLEKHLASNNYSTERWQVHCEDLQRLRLPHPENVTNIQHRHLLIIAGVGGDLTLDMVQAVLQNNLDCHIDFLICPVRQLHKVRSGVKALGLGLVNEKIVKDGGRYYEAIHLSTLSEDDIPVVGGSMWDLAKGDHQEYLRQNISHYQRMQAQGNENARNILAEYMSLQELSA